MAYLKINQNLITPDNVESIVSICPFGAMQYDKNGLSISSACKMCKLCIKKSNGIIEYVEEQKAELDKSLWKGICVYVDCQDGEIHRVTYELCGKAKELAQVTGHPVYALMIGSDVENNAKKLLHYGIDKIFVYDNKAFEHFKIEPYTCAFYDFINKIKPSSVLIGATMLGRQLAPRIATRCRTGLTADCTVLKMKENTDLVQIRPAFGGNIMAQIVSTNTRPQFCTVRYKVFSEPKPQIEESGEIISMSLDSAQYKSDIDVLDVIAKPKDVDISEADVIVAIGRGAQSEGAISLANELCDLLGGTLACTRPLAETGILNPKRQIGLSGRTVKPKFIICLGISGAVQFAAGMKSSDVIVAINTDKNAPIFNIAHYCVVGDVSEIVPKLISRIKGAK
mgnify:CR=1 FL=1